MARPLRRLSDTHVDVEHPSKNDNDGEDEDDYMSMTLPEEPSAPTQGFQARLKRKRETEERSHPKSQAEILADAARIRDEALSTALPASNRGAKMLKSMGYIAGSKLGRASPPPPVQPQPGSTQQDEPTADGNPEDHNEERPGLGSGLQTRHIDPLLIDLKLDRSGIGHADSVKTKLRTDHAADLQRQKGDELSFRDRVLSEAEEKRVEGMWWGAMKVAEAMDEDDTSNSGDHSKVKGNAKKKIRDVNVLWRALVLQRRQADLEARAKTDFAIALSSRAGAERHVSGRPLSPGTDDEVDVLEDVEGDDYDDFEDEELHEFLALSVGERVQKLVIYMRERWTYCFWCKSRYSDQEDLEENCPGLSEDDHD